VITIVPQVGTSGFWAISEADACVDGIEASATSGAIQQPIAGHAFKASDRTRYFHVVTNCLALTVRLQFIARSMLHETALPVNVESCVLRAYIFTSFFILEELSCYNAVTYIL
jgi:hypothetical protein